jgi:RNA exonuclease 4
MVGGGPNGAIHILARVSVTGCDGAILYDKFIQPTQYVTDLRAAQNSIASIDQLSPATGAITQLQLTKELTANRLLQQSLVVGHSLENDFNCLPSSLLPQDQFVRDTAHCLLLCPDPHRPRSLRALVAEKLGLAIQQDDARKHDSTEDARAVMQLYLHVRTQWETMRAEDQQRPAQERKEEHEELDDAFKPQATLVDTVLNYSLADFFDLPRVDKMLPIQSEFHSAKHYADTFRPMIVSNN